MTLINITDEEFEDSILKNSGVCLVDFWAEWCGPCKQISPILEEIASEENNDITIAKINIDENPNTPPKFGIRSIPTLILFKDGSVHAQKLGAMSKKQLTEFLEINL